MYDIVQNPIPKSGLFTTPTLEEIQKFIASLPSKEQANANLVFMFTLNSCNQLVEDKILSKEIFAQ
jgi:hypothetical protein